MTPHPDRVPAGSIALLLVIGLGWGLNWPFIRVAVAEIPPWTFRSICLVGGGALLMGAAWLQSRNVMFPRREFWPLVLVMFFNITCYQILVAFGLSMMEAGRGSILGFTFPLWTVLYGRWLLNERLTPARLAALILGLGAMIATAYSVLIGIFLCQWIWYRTLTRLPAAVATIAILSVPVVGVISSALMLDERIGPLDIVALVLVMGSLALVMLGPQMFVRLMRRRAA